MPASSSSSTKAPQPSLTAAQIMADLDSLNNCDPPAATALLTASSSLSPRQIRSLSKASSFPEPSRFDNLGRRIVVPALSRLTSESDVGGAKKQGQRGGLSPREGSANKVTVQKDVDMRRAEELVELFEKKENFKHLWITGLGNSKTKIDSVVQKYAEKEIEMKMKAARERQFEDQSFS